MTAGAARQKDIEEADKKKNEVEFKTIAWERTCTDLICCLIFVVFIASMVAITGYGMSQGDPYKIITPFDSVGNQCGQPGQKLGLDAAGTKVADMTEYPYRHFIDLGKFIESKGVDKSAVYKSVCVKACPEEEKAADCIPNKDSDYKCPKVSIGPKYYGTQLLSGTSFCVPDKELAKSFIEVVKK